MINIVIPMAGMGTRFKKIGYNMPKPLIDVNGHYMIEYVIKNVRPNTEHRFIFVCLKEHKTMFDIDSILRVLEPECEIVYVEEVTQGAACTVLLAEKYISNDDELMIANSDQYVDIDINDYLNAMGDNDGLIMTMTANDPKWSFVGLDDCGYVNQVREKEVISNEATVGIYNYKHGLDFVRFAKQMIDKDVRVNGEFYVAPVYNELIEAGKRITIYNVGSEDKGMYGLGIPSDLEKFMNNPVSDIW